jgi:hypothetical protein
MLQVTILQHSSKNKLLIKFQLQNDPTEFILFEEDNIYPKSDLSFSLDKKTCAYLLELLNKTIE